MTQKKLERVNYIVVHCSATPPTMDIGVKEIDRWHRERGWFKIGYHAVIRRDGRIEYGRYTDEIGAHAKGFNNQSLSICLVGGVDENNNPDNNFEDIQLQTLKAAINYYKYFFPDAAVVGHKDLKGVTKACPSFDVMDWWKNHATN